MKKIALAISFLSMVSSQVFAQNADFDFNANKVSTQMSVEDFQTLNGNLADFQSGPDRGGPWSPDPGGYRDHGWHFVGCGRRSKCVEMANGAGFPYGYAGIDANSCPHDNACYGRY